MPPFAAGSNGRASRPIDSGYSPLICHHHQNSTLERRLPREVTVEPVLRLLPMLATVLLLGNSVGPRWMACSDAAGHWAGLGARLRLELPCSGPQA